MSEAKGEYKTVNLFEELANKREKEIAPRSKRGRRAIGKKSSKDWISRTFLIRKETDLLMEGELYKLKVQGVIKDKSELVDELISKWIDEQNNCSSLQFTHLFNDQTPKKLR